MICYVIYPLSLSIHTKDSEWPPINGYFPCLACIQVILLTVHLWLLKNFFLMRAAYVFLLIAVALAVKLPTSEELKKAIHTSFSSPAASNPFRGPIMSTKLLHFVDV